MAILSDRDIVESMMTGYIGISDYHERGLTPNGYDLRIAEIQVRGDPEVKREGTVTIPPRTMFYVSTIERVRFPSDICAQLWLRTTWIRKGIIGAFGKIDAGFEGTLTLGAYNATDDPVEIPIGERFCQMVFESLNSESMQDYAKRSGNYQGQTGITLTPRKQRIGRSIMLPVVHGGVTACYNPRRNTCPAGSGPVVRRQRTQVLSGRQPREPGRRVIRCLHTLSAAVRRAVSG